MARDVDTLEAALPLGIGLDLTGDDITPINKQRLSDCCGLSQGGQPLGLHAARATAAFTAAVFYGIIPNREIRNR